MSTVVRRFAYFAALVVMALYGYTALRAGIPALEQKWDEIRKWEEGNANIRRDNEYRKKRIDDLLHNPETQEMEIRKRLKVQKPGETTLILPEAKSAEQGGGSAR